MGRAIAGLVVLGAALVLPQSAQAQSAMCAEPAFVSAGAGERAPTESDAPSPMRDEELPWCAGAEDPRCAPLPGHSSSIQMAVRQPLAAAAATVSEGARDGRDCKLTPHTGLC